MVTIVPTKVSNNVSNKAPTPKLLNLNAPTIRNQRTLIWLQNQDITVNWSKWDAIVTIQHYKYWSKYANIVGIIVNDIWDFDIDNLKKIPIILIPQKILSLKAEEYWLNFDNIMNLDNLECYPFINAWDGSVSDAVAILALLFRYNRIVDCTVSDLRASYLKSYPITFSNNIKPNETWVFTQFFKHTDKKRFLEINECLTRNCACPQIDKIILINEKKYDFNMPGSNKIHQI